MKQKYIDFYMDVASRTAELSSAVRLKVGAIIVKDNRIISIGYNGTPAGWDNTCEAKIWISRSEQETYDLETIERLYPYEAYSDLDDAIIGRYQLTTKPEVLHAERNALDKLARGNEGGLDATMFITHAPCLECAKSIYGAGINSIYYRDAYRSADGLAFLEKCGIKIEKVLDI